ncbi:CheR family methyltransferase [Pedobacter endophyticus]|uniref:protein-glutamate O-methyltransferase n=1 Tax=Pedobacter endophyticus TaxID=2789740 RepID=A0A7U3Q4S7_9SPHI|nr:CheR family methyltransferase [Pedobacter endophyticus]QPH38595.1 PAS domain S-box protein [Pedobacter endophyticus]
MGKSKVKNNKEPLNPVEQLQQKPSEFLIVGIGASAGGIQALQEFFRGVPEDSGMAYVVILHLSPDHDSQLAAILQQETKIRVTQVTSRTTIEANHLYVVPPDRHLTMQDGEIAVSPNLNIEERRAPVDIFFRSLADQHGPRAVCIVLSGTGANGSMGLKRIKERGGACFVQNPREAEFNEMPRHAIATELIDEVLNVAEIPAHIIAYRENGRNVRISEESGNRSETQKETLHEIFTQLRIRTGHDFSNYKQATLLRRIERRINVYNLPDLSSYLAYLQEHEEETRALLKDLLISVTNFFRDGKAFSYLEQEVIPSIFLGKTSGDQVRIWVAGCATGEEAYSLAMLCAEHAIRTHDAPKIQIFATDIDEAAIATAREGLYTLNDAADVSPERLRQFFTHDGDGYRARREIREMILFANHNFLKDPPFSKLDLVTCRNVLIYLNSTAQERVIETFHFALRAKKFLFLGTSESVDAANDLYTTFNRDSHIFQTREVAARTYPVPDSIPQLKPRTNLINKSDDQGTFTKRVSYGELHQKMLEQYAPPSLVINQDYEIVHMSERAGKYLEFAGGEPTKNLLKLIRPEIRLEIRATLYQAIQNKSSVELRNIKLSINGEAQSLNIHVRPVMEESDPERGFILLLFLPSEEVSRESKTLMVSAEEPMARQLEEELIGLKTQLRNSIEQYEYQAEELKASNEELQAMNEELRSAAEELETSKEELQSINEELRTVNQELKVKIEETSISSNNLQNLVNSANVGTIFLDRTFAIRLFTPAVLEIFNLKSGDYGRPVTDITNKLQNDNLLQDAEMVLKTLNAVEREVNTIDGRLYMMRLLPYRTSEDRINGVVITFFDITSRRTSEEALKISEERNRLLIESAKDYAIFTINNNREVISWSSGAELILGYTETEMLGKLEDIIFVGEDREAGVAEKELIQAEESGRAENEGWHLRKDGSRFWGSGTTQPLRDIKGDIIGYVKIMRDLTTQRELLEELRLSEENYRIELEKEVEIRTRELKESKEQYSTLIGNTPDVITRWDKNLKLVFANAAFERKMGAGIDVLLNKTNSDLGLPDSFVLPYTQSLVKAFETGQTVEHFSSSQTAGGESYFYSRLTPERNPDGELVSVLAIERDITDLKSSAIALKSNRDLLQSILDNSFISMSVLNAVRDERGNILDFEIMLTNRELNKETGRNDLVGKRYAHEYPGIRIAGLFRIMERVMETGIAEGMEYFYPHEGFSKWYSCMFSKIDDGLVATNMDITERKLAEEDLKNSEEQFRMFVMASSDLIYHMNADWTEMYAMQSDSFLSNTPSPAHEWLIHYIPAEEHQKVKAVIDEAIMHKRLFELEHRVLLANGRIGWANSRAVPLLDDHGEIIEWFGVASDITAQRISEDERDKNYLLLQQSEEVATTGTWVYDLQSRELSWSEGMYRLFNVDKELAIKPDIYLAYAIQDCKEAAARVVSDITNGTDKLEETLTILVGESEKKLRIKATLIKDGAGQVIRILGVDMDITASFKAEERLRQFEAEQQLQIFQVTLRTQEEERRRISESLHNGLGQLLYSTRLAINYLTVENATEKPDKFNESKEYTTSLLTDSIKATRRISHELMPTVLAEFGLSAAIKDVCEQLTSEVRFDCRVLVETVQLDNYVELAIFRTAQELMVNVVKHARATRAKVKIVAQVDEVLIEVRDNGVGVDQNIQDKPGIGLASIRNKADLLKGKVKISSTPGKGTKVEVRLPLKFAKSK